MSRRRQFFEKLPYPEASAWAGLTLFEQGLGLLLWRRFQEHEIELGRSSEWPGELCKMLGVSGKERANAWRALRRLRAAGLIIISGNNTFRLVYSERSFTAEKARAKPEEPSGPSLHSPSTRPPLDLHSTSTRPPLDLHYELSDRNPITPITIPVNHSNYIHTDRQTARACARAFKAAASIFRKTTGQQFPADMCVNWTQKERSAIFRISEACSFDISEVERRFSFLVSDTWLARQPIHVWADRIGTVPSPAQPEPSQAPQGAPTKPLDEQALGELFSARREAKGRGAYAMLSHDREAATAALSVLRQEEQPWLAARRSIDAYLADAEDFHRQRGLPFWGWAKDAGRWLADANRRRKNGQARTMSPMVDPEPIAERMGDAELAHASQLVMQRLKHGKRET